MGKRLVSRRSWRPGALFAEHAIRPDFIDNWATRLRDADSRSARAWAEAVFTVQFRPVLLLMRLRNALVKPMALFGRAPAPADLSRGMRPFTTLAAGDGEVVLGEDDSHLDFRVDLQVHPRFVSVATVVEIHNRLGRLYWSVVRWFHPAIVRAMLRRAPTVADPQG
ncbi:MAG: DUF2867 domain-containing protein [Bifidobacteriaceae bacterium]|jgi:hypothetical protein|nr:DUF2867 domain-containing protein [Bifidobacteriaceae bacterium]